MSIIDKDVRQVVEIYVDACTTGCGTLCGKEVYRTTFPPHMLDRGHPICELEALSTTVAIKLWAPILAGHKVLHDITLTCMQTPGDSLVSTADTLSRCHLGGMYQDRVQCLVRARV